ncbi:MAG: phage portal protein [Eubacterium sp.]|nr:phage portal protein [Eubacterium sp.]
MGLFSKREARAETIISPEMSAELLKAIMGEDGVSQEIIMSIPSVAASVDIITTAAAGAVYKLYHREANGRLVSETDKREELFNGDGGDLFSGYGMKKAWIKDWLLNGNGYIFIEKRRNEVKSLRYVDSRDIGIMQNGDPIFREVLYSAGSRTYNEFDFLRIVRRGRDGIKGEGLCRENALVAKLLNGMLRLLGISISAGGMKKGFLQTDKVVKQEVFNELKAKFKQLYTSADTQILLLQNGVTFTPAADSVTEMQLKDLYDGISRDVGEIIGVPEIIREGTAKEEEMRNWITTRVLPVCREIEGALNHSLLTEKEKKTGYFWQADISETMNGDFKRQVEGLKLAVEGNLMQIDEARDRLRLAPCGFNWMRENLASVFIDPESGVIYTPNTNAAYNFKEGKVLNNGTRPNDEGGARNE